MVSYCTILFAHCFFARKTLRNCPLSLFCERKLLEMELRLNAVRYLTETIAEPANIGIYT